MRQEGAATVDGGAARAHARRVESVWEECTSIPRSTDPRQLIRLAGHASELPGCRLELFIFGMQDSKFPSPCALPCP